MPDFIFLMHDDVPNGNTDADWGSYIGRLKSAGVFQGGSAIGGGACFRKSEGELPIASPLVGFIRVMADDLGQAKSLLVGHPDYEAGGTVEIRELPRTS